MRKGDRRRRSVTAGTEAARCAAREGRQPDPIGSAPAAPYSEPGWQEGAVAAGWQVLTSLQERAALLEAEGTLPVA